MDEDTMGEHFDIGPSLEFSTSRYDHDDIDYLASTPSEPDDVRIVEMDSNMSKLIEEEDSLDALLDPRGHTDNKCLWNCESLLHNAGHDKMYAGRNNEDLSVPRVEDTNFQGDSLYFENIADSFESSVFQDNCLNPVNSQITNYDWGRLDTSFHMSDISCRDRILSSTIVDNHNELLQTRYTQPHILRESVDERVVIDTSANLDTFCDVENKSEHNQFHDASLSSNDWLCQQSFDPYDDTYEEMFYMPEDSVFQNNCQQQKSPKMYHNVSSEQQDLQIPDYESLLPQDLKAEQELSIDDFESTQQQEVANVHPESVQYQALSMPFFATSHQQEFHNYDSNYVPTHDFQMFAHQSGQTQDPTFAYDARSFNKSLEDDISFLHQPNTLITRNDFHIEQYSQANLLETMQFRNFVQADNIEEGNIFDEDDFLERSLPNTDDWSLQLPEPKTFETNYLQGHETYISQDSSSKQEPLLKSELEFPQQHSWVVSADLSSSKEVNPVKNELESLQQNWLNSTDLSSSKEVAVVKSEFESPQQQNWVVTANLSHQPVPMFGGTDLQHELLLDDQIKKETVEDTMPMYSDTLDVHTAVRKLTFTEPCSSEAGSEQVFCKSFFADKCIVKTEFPDFVQTSQNESHIFSTSYAPTSVVEPFLERSGLPHTNVHCNVIQTRLINVHPSHSLEKFSISRPHDTLPDSDVYHPNFSPSNSELDTSATVTDTSIHEPISDEEYLSNSDTYALDDEVPLARSHLHGTTPVTKEEFGDQFVSNKSPHVSSEKTLNSALCSLNVAPSENLTASSSYPLIVTIPVSKTSPVKALTAATHVFKTAQTLNIATTAETLNLPTLVAKLTETVSSKNGAPVSEPSVEKNSDTFENSLNVVTPVTKLTTLKISNGATAVSKSATAESFECATQVSKTVESLNNSATVSKTATHDTLKDFQPVPVLVSKFANPIHFFTIDSKHIKSDKPLRFTTARNLNVVKPVSMYTTAKTVMFDDLVSTSTTAKNTEVCNPASKSTTAKIDVTASTSLTVKATTATHSSSATTTDILLGANPESTCASLGIAKVATPASKYKMAKTAKDYVTASNSKAVKTAAKISKLTATKSSNKVTPASKSINFRKLKVRNPVLKPKATDTVRFWTPILKSTTAKTNTLSSSSVIKATVAVANPALASVEIEKVATPAKSIIANTTKVATLSTKCNTGKTPMFDATALTSKSAKAAVKALNATTAEALVVVNPASISTVEDIAKFDTPAFKSKTPKTAIVSTLTSNSKTPKTFKVAAPVSKSKTAKPVKVATLGNKSITRKCLGEATNALKSTNTKTFYAANPESRSSTATTLNVSSPFAKRVITETLDVSVPDSLATASETCSLNKLVIKPSKPIESTKVLSNITSIQGSVLMPRNATLCPSNKDPTATIRERSFAELCSLKTGARKPARKLNFAELNKEIAFTNANNNKLNAGKQTQSSGNNSLYKVSTISGKLKLSGTLSMSMSLSDSEPPAKRQKKVIGDPLSVIKVLDKPTQFKIPTDCTKNVMVRDLLKMSGQIKKQPELERFYEYRKNRTKVWHSKKERLSKM